MDDREVIAWAVKSAPPSIDTASGIAEHIIAALKASGRVIVPVEPTEAMVSAGIIERHDQPTPEAWNKATANIYRAMIAAAKEPTDGR